MADTGGWKRIKKDECPHIAEFPPEADQPLAGKEDITSDKDACEVCAHNEDLRICLTCGAVHCCESHSAHNTEHFKETDHPFIKPHNSKYNWLWCYKCNAFLE